MQLSEETKETIKGIRKAIKELEQTKAALTSIKSGLRTEVATILFDNPKFADHGFRGKSGKAYKDYAAKVAAIRGVDSEISTIDREIFKLDTDIDWIKETDRIEGRAAAIQAAANAGYDSISASRFGQSRTKGIDFGNTIKIDYGQGALELTRRQYNASAGNVQFGRAAGVKGD